MKAKLKFLFLLFLIDLMDNSLFKIIMATMCSIICAYVYIWAYIYIYIYIYIYEMNDSNDTSDEREELGIFCYYNMLELPVKCLFESGPGFIVNIYCKL